MQVFADRKTSLDLASNCLTAYVARLHASTPHTPVEKVREVYLSDEPGMGICLLCNLIRAKDHRIGSKALTWLLRRGKHKTWEFIRHADFLRALFFCLATEGSIDEIFTRQWLERKFLDHGIPARAGVHAHSSARVNIRWPFSRLPLGLVCIEYCECLLSRWKRQCIPDLECWKWRTSVGRFQNNHKPWQKRSSHDLRLATRGVPNRRCIILTLCLSLPLPPPRESSSLLPRFPLLPLAIPLGLLLLSHAPAPKVQAAVRRLTVRDLPFGLVVCDGLGTLDLRQKLSACPIARRAQLIYPPALERMSHEVAGRAERAVWRDAGFKTLDDRCPGEDAVATRVIDV